ncbi:hypothetical protein GALL_277270 [mine drainage metagenome]|uniref:Uncharacterized protein n=1 Tax=mine drainage metagenome TaxID=410659 RepID=A0A1J5RQN7_9ZZZZ
MEYGGGGLHSDVECGVVIPHSRFTLSQSLDCGPADAGPSVKGVSGHRTSVCDAVGAKRGRGLKTGRKAEPPAQGGIVIPHSTSIPQARPDRPRGTPVSESETGGRESSLASKSGAEAPHFSRFTLSQPLDCGPAGAGPSVKGVSGHRTSVCDAVGAKRDADSKQAGRQSLPRRAES